MAEDLDPLRGVDDTTAAALDLAVPDRDLPPAASARRRLLRAAGVLPRTAGGVAVDVAARVPTTGPPRRVRRRTTVRHWLAGDHHVHTVFSPDGRYTVLDHALHAHAYGLDWMVVTDHGGPAHVRVGVRATAPEIRAARRALPGLLLFQGLEWNIPAAEHGTVVVAPGRHDVAVLEEFEREYDGVVTGSLAATPANEALALAGIAWLGRQIDDRRLRDALFLANHPSRQGLDSPHELRNWRDTDPRIAVGFEGAPGHQAAGIPRPVGPGENRGYYGRDRGTDPHQWQPYPQESYRTWGGFDWMTATVGGLWDSMLAEGRPWSITANSDSHDVYLHPGDRPPGADEALFDRLGRYPPPVHVGGLDTSAADFWPGFYSRTVVGAESRGYQAVLRGLRDGLVWVDHGRLVAGMDVQVRERDRPNRAVPLGSTLTVPRGTAVELAIRIRPAHLPNWGGSVPRLARVDVIQGAVTGAPADRDAFTAPDTRVVRAWDASGARGTLNLVHPLGPAEQPFYVRLRATDGRFSQVGARGAHIDPHGPRMDPVGAVDPWDDLWAYTNPVWVEVAP